MIKRFTLVAIALFFALANWAGNIPQQEAEQVAKNAFHEFTAIPQSDIELGNPFIKYNGNNALYYIFNIENHKGFVIVSADDRAFPVIGYSLTGRYTEQNQPPQFVSWMEGYTLQMSEIIEKNIEATPQIESKWNNYKQEATNFTYAKNTKNVTPLLDPIAWNQDAGWNSQCPADPAGPGGHVYAGCVATAAGMVMKYWEHPSTGQGSSTYYCAPYGTLTANYGEATYDWASMSNASWTNAAAYLLFHIGVSVQMNYAPDGSGAYTANLVNTFENNFRYLPSADFQLKEDHPTDWKDILMEELDNGRPMVYKGYSAGSGGHAFCCDGYSSNGTYFHFNWGWSGYQNGNFMVSSLNPGGYNFNENQGAVIGISPDLTPIPTLDPPTNLAAEVADDDVTLTWDSPLAPSEGFEDGFESYEDFSLSFGDWTQIDGDGGATYIITDHTFPNQAYTGAFIIFDPSGVTPANPSGWEAHSGDNFAACFNAVTASAPNDDWIITPQISISSGDELAFWVKSITDQYGLEKFKVGVSTSGTTPGDFTIISSGSHLEAPVEWTEYTYDLSAYDGQDIYIGIHVISNDAFCFFLDDFTVGSSKETKFANGFEKPAGNKNTVSSKTVYEGQSVVADLAKNTKSLEGFQVYRDGSATGSQLSASTTEYTDSDLSNGSYTYYVTAVYADGESEASNEVTAEVSVGVEENSTVAAKMYPNPAEDILNIDFANNTNYQLTFRDVTGRIVYQIEGQGTENQISLSNLKQGVYFVEVKTEGNSFTERVVIK